MKNSPTSKSRPSPPSPPQTLSVQPPTSQPPLNDQERNELIQLRREKGALSMMLWEAVQRAAPETHVLELPNAISDPLWLLVYEPGLDGKTIIMAGTIPPITEQEKKRVVRILRGTTKPIEEVLRELELRHPGSYVEQQIAGHLKWAKQAPAVDGKGSGYWESVRPPGFGERVKNALHLPQ